MRARRLAVSALLVGALTAVLLFLTLPIVAIFAEIPPGRLLDGCGLVFLSSCEAGQGGLTLGLDEHAGLPAAIELAGARAIVSPLWRVDDVASAVFAQLFYEGLLCSSGEIDLGTLVSRTRFSMRDT